ncbi:hypothetical protein LTR48_000366 [Friedmanniomyces endolithicus]|uniref:Uncharacterized protein n=1 Tax=Rachicladosporium monterosium TaxID=1507873 RepID=A0ABR0LGX0_9PEZI|nr:hypothetical protein LTR48_000366 [Friedmanniomyces endolithicus]KAK5148563.1 hypothetical protein LTR32_000160 [Rachicladosporium monterosium]
MAAPLNTAFTAPGSSKSPGTATSLTSSSTASTSPPATFLKRAGYPPTSAFMSELPEEYELVFDVVTSRTIYGAVIDKKIHPLLSNMLRMLKH